MRLHKFREYLALVLIAAISVFIGMWGLEKSTAAMTGIAVIIPVLFSVCLSSKDTVLLLGLLLPANRVLTIGGCSVLILLALMFIIKGILKKSLYISQDILLMSFIFVIYAGIVSKGEQLLGAGKIILMLYYFLIVLQAIDIRQLFVELVGSITGGIVISSIITVLVSPATLAAISRFEIGHGGGNILGIECGVLAVCLLVVLLKEWEGRIWVCVQLCSLLLIGLMTSSKSFLLVLVVGVVWIVLFSIVKSTAKQMRTIVFGLLLFVVVFIILLLISDTFKAYCGLLIRRIVSPHAGDISNGRFSIWNDYFNLFITNPKYVWFGNVNYVETGIDYVAHNMIIEQIALYGIFGSIMLIYLYVKVFNEIKQSKRGCYKVFSIAAAPMVAFLVVSMTSHTLLGFPQTFLLFICWMCGAFSTRCD